MTAVQRPPGPFRAPYLVFQPCRAYMVQVKQFKRQIRKGLARVPVVICACHF